MAPAAGMDASIDDSLPDPGAADAHAMISKLAALEVARKAEREQRLAAAKELADPRESVDGFLAWFNEQQADIQKRCTLLSDSAPGDAASAIQAPAPAQGAEALVAQVAALEQALADASYFLPSYDLRSASATVQSLRGQAEAARAALAPKRKFSFASKRVSRVAAAAPEANDAASSGTGWGSVADGAGVPTAAGASGPKPTAQGGAAASAASAAVTPAISASDAELIAAGRGVASLRGCIITRTAAELAGGEFVVADCSDCTIQLLGPLRALRLQGLERCTLAAGPVSGATFVVAAHSCSLYLASQQVRIHSSSGTDLYLRVGSRPIIEHSERLRFAPMPSPSVLAALEPPASSSAPVGGAASPSGSATAGEAGSAGSGDMGGAVCSGLWQQVEDFGWVKATHSPHWCVLPEAERLPLRMASGEGGPALGMVQP